MIRICHIMLVSAVLAACTPITQQTSLSDSRVISEDIPRFWEAYDRIVATDDPQEQLALLNDLYIDPGTPGLHAMNRARNYRTSEYLQAINDYPAFWTAVRPRTLDVERHRAAIEAGLDRLMQIYEPRRDVPVYFVIGALRAGGTATDGKMLIGAELAMADASVPAHELSERLAHLERYFANDPIDGLIDLNLHEYIHAVQHSAGGSDLLSWTLFEGVAEYVSTRAIGRTSEQPAILYGKVNHAAVIEAFIRDIDAPDPGNWIWNGDDNPFGQGDLGYYVGYVIADRFLAQADDREAAIAELIEMDYQDESEVARVVDASGVFEESVAVLRARHATSEAGG